MSPPPEDVPLVLLLRSPDAEGEDRYVRALAERGFRAACRPALRFVSASGVLARLRRPERYAGLILTSPRAAQAAAGALRTLPEDQQATWAEKPAFAVGSKTAEILRASGLAPVGEESGSASSLGAVVTRTWHAEGEGPSDTRPVLFLCGNRRRDDLPNRLRAEGIPFEECVAYETRLRSGPWLAGRPDWAVFFSPSGVEAVRQAREAGWDDVRKAAFGPTTAAAMREAGWPPDATAAHPTPRALAKTLREAVRQESEEPTP